MLRNAGWIFADQVARSAISRTDFMTDGDYIELHARSAFSFLRGTSLPEQLTRRAAHLGMPAIAVLDRMGVYGGPRVFNTGKEAGIRPILGAELRMEDESILPVSAVGFVAVT